MFSITENKGFHLTFENGLTVSVQWGFQNYCENHRFEYLRGEKVPNCVDAEIAIWNAEKWVTNDFIDCHGDDVCGRLSADDVADIIIKVKNYKP